MGRRIEHNRKISSDRVRKVRKQKSKILIAAEGKNKTEKTCFSNFENGKKPYNITYARGNNTDPLKLVKMLIKEIDNLKLDLQDDDIAYCIFDTDVDSNKNKIIEEAIQLAKTHNIKIITSSPCFELWFLLHYDYTTASMNNEELIKRLKSHYSKYSKNCNIYPVISSKTKIAYDRAKKLEKYQIDNSRNIKSVEANPHTEVYQIIDELEK